MRGAIPFTGPGRTATNADANMLEKESPEKRESRAGADEGNQQRQLQQDFTSSKAHEGHDHLGGINTNCPKSLQVLPNFLRCLKLNLT